MLASYNTDKFLRVSVSLFWYPRQQTILQLFIVQLILDQVRFPPFLRHAGPPLTNSVMEVELATFCLMSENSFWSKAGRPDWLYTFVLTLYETWPCLTATTRQTDSLHNMYLLKNVNIKISNIKISSVYNLQQGFNITRKFPDENLQLHYQWKRNPL